jgi:hypothetical protein
MAEKSYCIEFVFTSKEGHIRRQAVVEVPDALVLRKQTESVNKDRREKGTALELAREVALAAFSDANWVVGRITRMRFGMMIDLRSGQASL